MNITTDELYDLLTEDLGIDEETLNKLIRHNYVVPTDRTGRRPVCQTNKVCPTATLCPNNVEEE